MRSLFVAAVPVSLTVCKTSQHVAPSGKADLPFWLPSCFFLILLCMFWLAELPSCGPTPLLHLNKLRVCWDTWQTEQNTKHFFHSTQELLCPWSLTDAAWPNTSHECDFCISLAAKLVSCLFATKPTTFPFQVPTKTPSGRKFQDKEAIA